ncbi:MAG TPA: S9 family peptidase [Longimicrobiales bacterium]|nr:S9 family peptidase [Longimicrobiales bacterium]
MRFLNPHAAPRLAALLLIAFTLQPATVAALQQPAPLGAPAAGGAATVQQAGLTPLQVAELVSVAAVAISDDGRHVAYTLTSPPNPSELNDPTPTFLHILDTQTGQTRELFAAAGVAGIAFRPGHSTVTFLATQQGSPRGVYEVDVAGGAARRVYTFERPLLSFAWAPDGNRLAFVANEAVTPPATPLPYTPIFFEENVPQREGWVVDVASNAAPRRMQPRGSYYQMEWSPDGNRIAVGLAPTPTVDDSYMRVSVLVLDAGSLQQVAAINNEGKLGQIRWSPDGSRLALRAADNIHDPIDGRIMVVPASGGTPRNILPRFEGKFEDILWTGANEIHFVASEGVMSTYGSVAPDGSNLRRLAQREGLAFTAFARAGNGQAAFSASTPLHPAEVYVLAANQAEPRRMTQNNAWLADVPMGEQRIVRWQPRDNAYELEGMLVMPVGFAEGTRVPVITMVHGGPEAHYLNGWLTNYSMPGQMAAARGYAVFYPNYRGSTGRGLEFAMSSQADLAGAEFDDIVDGVDHLIRTGVADSARIGVTGGSYGGYATAWMSTYYSDRFAAGVMFVGISNNLSKWGTSDIPEELYLVHSRQRLWEGNWQKYLERSPVYHVDRAQTPLLIMHGAEDTRVHPGQSLELYRHLVVRKPDVPVRLILYPGEGHGNVRSASRLDYTLRMIEWFDSFLMGEGEMPALDITLEQARRAAPSAAAPAGG